jgi:copper oxidase (laccase) domain-containing protein
MSRHMMTQGDRRFVFGWDQPLMSFFLQVYDRTRKEDDQTVAWLGASAETQMYEVEELVQAASEHGLEIEHAMQIQLYGERDDGR